MRTLNGEIEEHTQKSLYFLPASLAPCANKTGQYSSYLLYEKYVLGLLVLNFQNTIKILYLCSCPQSSLYILVNMLFVRISKMLNFIVAFSCCTQFDFEHITFFRIHPFAYEFSLTFYSNCIVFKPSNKMRHNWFRFNWAKTSPISSYISCFALGYSSRYMFFQFSFLYSCNSISQPYLVASIPH